MPALSFDLSLQSSSSQTIDETLTSLLGPLMEAIVGARTRVYISQETVVAAVECITSLLDQLLLGYLKTHCDGTYSILHIQYIVIIIHITYTIFNPVHVYVYV